MGNNGAYTIMEQMMVAAYDAGLRGEQLAPFMETYRGTDIDSGGQRDIETQDGKGINEIIVEAFGTPEQLAAWKSWLAERNEELEDAAYDALFSITRDRFGWC